MYYPASWSVEKIQEYHPFNEYTCFDESSAHKYLTEDFDVNQNDCVADIGAAEGLFSLAIVDKVKKIYIFEGDNIWLKPLNATFRDYQDKIVIINKYVSDINWNTFVTLDKFF